VRNGEIWGRKKFFDCSFRSRSVSIIYLYTLCAQNLSKIHLDTYQKAKAASVPSSPSRSRQPAKKKAACFSKFVISSTKGETFPQFDENAEI